MAMMRQPHFIRCLALAGLLSLGSLPGHAQPALDWSLVDGIGGVSANGGVAILGTVSAEDANFGSAGGVSIHSVFQPAQIFFPIYHPPPRPVLQITHATNHVVIRWSAFFPSNYLESATHLLGASTTWTNVTTLPVAETNQWQLVLPVDQSTRFFRLRRP